MRRVSGNGGARSPRKFRGTAEFAEGLRVGLDVGSATVKAVVLEPRSGEILWKDYERHETRQTEKVLSFLERIEAAFPGVPHESFRIFATGSGGNEIAPRIGARFVQEVNAVTLAVERRHPDAHSVIELGGQDAKIIVFLDDPAAGRRKKVPSMNDKCAGGTGAVIDKIGAKLQLSPDDIARAPYRGVRLHPVAGKCGVFAETDINGLQKQGVPALELMASLFESVVLQNLSVLTRGHTLHPKVLLLGGPNTYLPGLQDCWRHNIPRLWQERGVALPAHAGVDELIVVPPNAQFFAAIGAAEFAQDELVEDPDQGVYQGTEELRWYLEVGRGEEKQSRGLRGLWQTPAELEHFRTRYRPVAWQPPAFAPKSRIDVFVGLDGGSTSTKAVLLDARQRVVATAYRLSLGNPIEDTIRVLGDLCRPLEEQGCALNVLGVGTTGYAKDILKDVLRADVALVETVAHANAGLHFYPGSDVIVDVGGQDIKLIVLKNGTVKDFKLNSQCSAGNGYFLQATAASFGYAVEDYADVAFSADAMPNFGYGCTVFMQTDIVDFQRQGWQPNEIMAGLASVLPKNIWLYVSQIPNLPRLGRKFLLQGGTQHNLAAVKAQVDFISSRFRGTGVEPEIVVHRHCAESGAIGCALEAHRLHFEHGRRTEFIGFEAVQRIRYRTSRGEETRCLFCKNRCLRTFVTVSTSAAGAPAHDTASADRQIIVASCEKGAVDDVDAMREIKRGLDATKSANPSLVEISAREVFRTPQVEIVADPPRRRWRLPVPGFPRNADRHRILAQRARVRIGLPRVLNLYSHAPFFSAWFAALGVPGDAIVWSDCTSEELYRDGVKRGSIDPCFPSKVCLAHVHNLLHRHHGSPRPLTHVFFPMIDDFPGVLADSVASRTCTTVAATAESVHAAFVKEGDLFAAGGIVFKKTFVNLVDPALAARQLYLDWKDELDLTETESLRAVQQGLAALRRYEEARRREARAVLDRIEREGQVAVVLLARPYHNDPGINHEIPAELQKLGYPVLTQDSLPLDPDILERLFGEEVRRGEFPSPLSIADAWKNSYSENTSRKIWAAKFVARHPNLVALELSSFKCGHDAPVYSTVEEIIENSGTPYFSFKDIDENRPAASIRLRIETIAYFLARHREKLAKPSAGRHGTGNGTGRRNGGRTDEPSSEVGL